MFRYPTTLRHTEAVRLLPLWLCPLQCIGHLKHGKSDGTSLSSDFLIYAAAVFADALAQLFTAILRHG